MTSVSECSSTETMERMQAILSHILAWSGKCSQMLTPATLVWIGLNSPANSFGASGFRAYMSMCEGPPRRENIIGDFARVGPEGACARPHGQQLGQCQAGAERADLEEVAPADAVAELLTIT